MEEKKQGGKRRGAGRKPVLNKKKQISLYVEGHKVVRFGSEDKMKAHLYTIIDEFGQAGNVGSMSIQDLTQPTGQIKPITDTKPQSNVVMSVWEEKPKLSLKRTPAHWVDLRRECLTADDFAKWLEDLENDTFLTTREKAQIKQTV